MEWIIQLPVLFFSVIVHEFCHGWSAYRRGDDTASRRGRLTLSPWPHIDPFGTVFVPLLCFFLRMPMFGWAKPVPVRESRLRRPKTDSVHVALAGPISNLTLALAAVLAYKLVSITPIFASEFKQTLLELLFFAVNVNLFLAFFNLLPLHPLDGGKVLGGLLPLRLRLAYDRHGPYGALIVTLLLFTPIFSAMVFWPAQLAISFFRRMGLLG